MYFKEQSEQFAKLLEALKDRKVAVIGHVRPDGDCIGSTVALVRILRAHGIDAVGVNGDPVPATLTSFVGDTPLHKADAFKSGGHVAITVDCADRKRIGPILNEVFPDIWFNIDHHVSNRKYAEQNMVVGTASATAELLAGICADLNITIDPVTAQALYVGVATDTGQFRFPSTTPATFELACFLCEHGAHPSAAAHELYERESFGKIKLLQHFLDSLRLEMDGRICIGLIEDGVYDNCGASIDDSEGLVDYARSIEGVDVGVLLEDRGGMLKGSLRAKNPFYTLEQVARQFNGGGHACAAGFNVEHSSIETFLPELTAALKQHLQALGSPPAQA